VARTVDIAAHIVRREAFVSAAARLFQVKGYEQTSIQEVLEAVGASRGAFYHYFESKAALLDAVVELIVLEAMGSAERLDATGLTAVERLRALVDGIASWKSEHVELSLAVAETWLSDHNALVRERFRRLVAARLTPKLATIVRQGVAEGTFVARDADCTAQVLVALWLSLNITATELFLASRAGVVAFEEVVHTVDGYLDAFDRVLGARPGTFPRPDPEALRPWFGRQGEKGPA
jgi:AcrR family transcriptional regulator